MATSCSEMTKANIPASHMLQARQAVVCFHSLMRHVLKLLGLLMSQKE